MENKEQWKIQNNRFVAYLDFLGFKEYVLRNTPEKVYNVLKNLLDNAKNIEKKYFNEEKYKGKTPHIATFSDSIFIFSFDDTSISFEIIVKYVSVLMYGTMSENGLPMKGTIAHGNISVDKENHLYCGLPLIDAYLFQEDVYYFGVVFHHSVDKFLYKKKRNIKNYIQYFFEKPTHLKSGNITHNNVNWFIEIQNENEFNSIIKKMKTSASGHQRKYLDNTVEMYNKIKENI